MNAAIILFSPSGNTKRVAELLQTCLEKNQIMTQTVNITGDRKYFATNDQRVFWKETVKAHDLLFVGAPVYTHHLQHHVKDLIKNLPQPTGDWGELAIPFVTYGGVSSGIALDEAGKLLRKSGRKVLLGLKVAGSHHMTKAFMDQEYNQGKPGNEILAVIEELVRRVKQVNPNNLKDCSKQLKYQDFKTYLLANLVFQEKVWHQKRYPKVVVNDDQCLKCGQCVGVCPVCHLEQRNDKSVIRNEASQCIHCFNCIFACPQKAIYPAGDLASAREFMHRMLKKAKEEPETCLYPRLG
jgi:ferredoxin/NAD(P)H-dependent FMN reductase